MDVVLAIALGAGLGALTTSIISLFVNAQAERSIVRELKKHQDLLSALLRFRVSLESESPDSDEVAQARQILVHAADVLNQREKKEIVGTLDRGSDKSKANYIVKLLDEVAK
jgi:hypothetical protein